MRDDAEARQLVDSTMTAFALPERPRAYVCDDDAMRCPWCNHLPTNQGIDAFWVLSDAHVVARRSLERLPTRMPEPALRQDLHRPRGAGFRERGR
ncbi:MAG: hypothetical protein ACHREM_32270 [Polyangiales bacterium]